MGDSADFLRISFYIELIESHESDVSRRGPEPDYGIQDHTGPCIEYEH